MKKFLSLLTIIVGCSFFSVHAGEPLVEREGKKDQVENADKTVIDITSKTEKLFTKYNYLLVETVTMLSMGQDIASANIAADLEKLTKISQVIAKLFERVRPGTGEPTLIFLQEQVDLQNSIAIATFHDDQATVAQDTEALLRAAHQYKKALKKTGIRGPSNIIEFYIYIIIAGSVISNQTLLSPTEANWKKLTDAQLKTFPAVKKVARKLVESVGCCIVA